MAHMICKFLKVLLLLLFISCNNKTEFFILSDLRSDLDMNETGNGRQIAEYFVISNPPKNLDSLYALVSKYNDTTLNYCKITDKEFVAYKRFFYKETKATPRDYKESVGFVSDEIVDHLDDLIAYLEYDKKTNWKFKIKTNNNPDEWRETQIEFDCD